MILPSVGTGLPHGSQGLTGVTQPQSPASLFNEGEIGQYQLEQDTLKSMLERKSELEARLADLEIYAPQSGSVLARDLATLSGRHFTPGTEILSIAQRDQIHAVALTRQTDIDWVAANPEAEIELLVWGRHENDLLAGKIKHINPRARDDLPHEAFAASAGGPLAVVPRSQVEGSEEESENDMMLTQPRVPIEIELHPEDRKNLVASQTGQLIVRSREQNMGTYIAQGLSRFIEKNNYRTHGL